MSLLEVRVHERAVNTYYHEGKTWIEGRKGSPYSIYFHNTTGNKRKIVVSVDGLNVMTGDVQWGRGYLVDPYGSIEIPGWRHDGNSVHEFTFSSPKDSYNAHSLAGAMANIGVIGCMVFDENVRYNYIPPYKIQSNIPYVSNIGNVSDSYIPGGVRGTSMGSVNINTSYIPESTISPLVGPIGGPECFTNEVSLMLQNSVSNLGTGYGDHKEFHTQNVEFQAHSIPSVTLTLYYDDWKGLERRGVVRRHVAPMPSPFPGFNDGVPPPR